MSFDEYQVPLGSLYFFPTNLKSAPIDNLVRLLEFSNILSIDVQDEVLKVDKSSSLSFGRMENMPYIFVTLDVSKGQVNVVNFSQLINIPLISVQLFVSKLERSNSVRL